VHGPAHVLEHEPPGSIWTRTERDQLANVHTSTALMVLADVDASGTVRAGLYHCLLLWLELGGEARGG
jgi:hypothetical protein